MSGPRTFAPTLMIGVLTVALVPIAATPSSNVSATSAPPIVGTPSRFAPVGPLRLADTREAVCGCTPVDAATIRVQIAGRAGIATGITAAAVTITAAGPTGTGFVTVYPAGTARPETSILNLQAGRDTANSGIVPVGADGAIDVYANVASGLIVDVTGTFTPTTSARAGRFEPVAPTRLLDTRAEGGAPLAPGGQTTVALPSGVSADATAVAVNVTSVGGADRRVLQRLPSGAGRVERLVHEP